MADQKINHADEIWKPVHIEHFRENYSVSNHGRVRRDRLGKNTQVGKILKNIIKDNGYLFVNLCAAPHCKEAKIHVLVAWAFLSPPPGSVGRRKGEYQVNHKDCVKTNNRPGNLEWLTVEQHHAHSTINVLIPRGERHYGAKLTEADVLEIRKRYKAGGVTHETLGKEFRVAPEHIGCIIRRRCWGWL